MKFFGEFRFSLNQLMSKKLEFKHLWEQKNLIRV